MTNKEELRDSIKDIENAKLFHDTYERLAPDFGYETRLDTKQFDPFSDNGRLMIETCRIVIEQIRKADMERVFEEIKKYEAKVRDDAEDMDIVTSTVLGQVIYNVIEIIKQSHE